MNHWMGLDDAVMIKDNHIAVIKGQEHCRQDTEPGGSVEAIARPD
jgi:nicotinate-nucleotide pyrophosphorylase